MDEELKQYLEGMEQRSKQQAHALSTLVENVKESLEREIRSVGDRVDRMCARLDKIAAGSHYVTRLVEWSENRTGYRRTSSNGSLPWKRV